MGFLNAKSKEILQSQEKFSKLFDHTILKPYAIPSQIDKLCEEAKEYNFASVCVNSCHVARAAERLQGADVKVCTVIGFPLGAMSTLSKCSEAKYAVKDGAQELDMVINIGMLKAGEYSYVYEDIAAVAEAAEGYPVKVILETSLLTKEEIVKACKLCVEAKAAFVKNNRYIM